MAGKEDLDRLEAVGFREDCFRISVPLNCTFYSPVKLRPIIHSDAAYCESERRGAYYLPYSYPRRNRKFGLFRLPDSVITRFVELLAPLSLLHFSRSSKSVYYECLDTRGLEFKHIRDSDGDGCSIFVDCNDGRLMSQGSLEDKNWVNYQICFNVAEIRLRSAPSHSLNFNFVKRYKVLVLWIVLQDELLPYCERLFHPGVEHVKVEIGSEDEFLIDENQKKITVACFTQFLNYCKDVKTMRVKFPKFSFFAVRMTDHPDMDCIKEMLESWAQTTTRLQVFHFIYSGRLFQLHGKQLKRVVKVDRSWFVSEKCQFPYQDNCFVSHPHYEYHELYMSLPMYLRLEHYDKVFKTLCELKHGQ